MTNTSENVTSLRVQTLNTYNVTRKEHEPAEQFLRDDRIELGRVVLYSVTRDDVRVSGIFDTRLGLADVDARDQNDNVLLHISEIPVERRGLASFEHRGVTERSLADIANIGFAWAALAAREAEEPTRATEVSIAESVELISV